jgi:hypothetical protein
MAELGIADCLAAGPKDAETLAAETGSHAGTLYRFLRALASAGVLQEVEPRRFALNSLSETLRSDRPGSLRPMARLGGHPLHWQAWGNLLHSVRTGQPAFDSVHGMSFFDALAADATLTRTFHGVLAQLDDVDRDVADALDLTACGSLVDVGGGAGGLARRIVAVNPGVSVILFDASHALALAPSNPRIEPVAGNFLDNVPRGADTYVLKFVLHDWDDARAIRILRNCRVAMPAHGRVFVIEVVVPDGTTPSAAKKHDLNMLVLTGGRERRLDEYRSLFSAAGLELGRTTFTRSGVAILSSV